MGYTIQVMCRCDGTGRRTGLKIPRWQHRAGSTPATGTNKKGHLERCPFFLCFAAYGQGVGGGHIPVSDEREEAGWSRTVEDR